LRKKPNAIPVMIVTSAKGVAKSASCQKQASLRQRPGRYIT
jgi:hypothetical protein